MTVNDTLLLGMALLTFDVIVILAAIDQAKKEIVRELRNGKASDNSN